MENENGENGTDSAEDIAEDIADEIVDEIVDEIADETADVDVDIAVVEAPVIPETASVVVGDLNITGPPEMVRQVTEKYLKDHIDHNPHDTPHGNGDGPLDEIGETITPAPVEDIIQETAASETVDAPPGPTDWLFRDRGGH